MSNKYFKNILIGLLILANASFSFAGNQIYVELSNSTKAQLTSLISDNPVTLSSFSTKEEETAWINSKKDRVARLNRQSDDVNRIYLQAIHYEATRAGLEPELVLGLIEVESGFKKYVISSAGAIGLMQVMPFWLNLLGSGKDHNLFHMITNLRYGCVILRHYLEVEKGDIVKALARYNGSVGKTHYSEKVLSARLKWL